MFILEGVPPILLAFAVLAFLTDRPEIATWLKPDEKEWLTTTINAEKQALLVQEKGYMSIGRAFSDLRVISLALMYFTIVTATYGITYFMPLIVKGFGHDNVATGLLTAIPYVIGTIGLLIWSWSSDRTHERKWHYIVGCLLAGVGLAVAGFFGSTVVALVAVSAAAVGLYGCKPAFWAMPSEFLTGTAAAAGIAMINSIGNLGGFVGPFMVGWIKDFTGSYDMGLYFLTGCAILSAVLAMLTAPGRKSPAPVGASVFRASV
jgi:MFS transporter, ACS family, tartrate transporter